MCFPSSFKCFWHRRHDLSVESLQSISRKCLDLFVTYLSKRIQSVKIDDVWRVKINIQYGIPQWIILDTTLFNIYINGMFSIASRGEFIEFAVVISFFTKPKHDKFSGLLSKQTPWIKKLRTLLKVNVEKTFYTFLL